MSESVGLASNARWSENDNSWRPEPPPWKAKASCAGADRDLFFPGRGENDRINAAKAICASCPVRVECLDFALANRELFGIWGGTTEKERRRLRARRQPGRPAVEESRRRTVRAMATRLTSVEIARELGLSRRTVARYLDESP